MTTLDIFLIVGAFVLILLGVGFLDKLAKWAGWED